MRIASYSRGNSLLACLALTSFSPVAAQTEFGNGTFEWVRFFPSYHDNYDCAFDPWGDIYIAGRIVDSLPIGDTTLYAAGNTDVWLAKLDSVGGVIWVIQGNAIEDAYPRAIECDSEGNLVMAVAMYSDMIVDGVSIQRSAGNCDMLVLKFDPDGHLLWHYKSSGSGSFAVHLDVGADDAIVVVTSNVGTNVYDQDTISIFWEYVGCIVKLGSDGQKQWVTRIDDDAELRLQEVAMDELGQVYVVGYCGWPTLFGNEFTFVDSGARKIFVSKLDQDGHFVWVRRETQSGDNTARNVAIYGDHLYVSGNMDNPVPYGSYTFDPDVSAVIGWRDVNYLAQYDTSGVMNWFRYGYGTYMGYTGLDVSESEVVTVLGEADNTVYFTEPDSSLTFPAGGAFWAQFDAQGNRLDLRHLSPTTIGARWIDSWEDRIIVCGVCSDSCFFPTDSTFMPDLELQGFLFMVKDEGLALKTPSERSSRSSLLIYPSPSSEVVRILLPDNANGPGLLRVTDALGKEVLRTSLPVHGWFELDIRRLVTGQYHVLLVLDGKVHHGCFIKM